MPRRHLMLPILLMLAAPLLAADGFHKWYDKDGQAVYSQFAPPEGSDSEIVKPPPPPAESPEVAQQRLQEQLQRSADFLEDKELAATESAAKQAALDRDMQRCTQARRNLELLNGPARQLFQMPDGSVQRLSDEDRQARRVEAQKVIDESCR
jgi:hypothetical protein